MPSEKIISAPASNGAPKPGFYLFTAQVWMGVAAILFALNLLLVVSLLSMAPELQVVSQIAITDVKRSRNIQTSRQLVEVLPFSMRLGDKPLLDEMLVRYYIRMRHTEIGDSLEMGYRWGPFGPVALMSAPHIYAPFWAARSGQIERMWELTYTKSVEFIRIYRRTPKDPLFTVDFDVYTWNGQPGRPQRQRYTSVLEVRDLPGQRIFLADFVNPYGLTVLAYDESEKKQER